MKRSKAASVAAALCIAAAGVPAGAGATTWCVSTAGDLRAKLLVAASNGEDDVIRLVRGNYLTGGSGFSFNSTQAFALTINGGFDASCTTGSQDARDTVLDGGGASQVLAINGPGSIAIRHLTIRNGLRSGSSGGGLQMTGSLATSQVVLAACILRDNTSDYAVGGAIIDGEGEIHVDGNLVTGNSAPNNGVLYLYGGTTTSVYMTNNTIAGNSASGAAPTMVFINYRNGAVPSSYLANNVFWGNTGGTDLQLYDGRTLLDHNDYAAIAGTPAAGSGGNLGVDPQFAAAGNFHLSATSPLLGAGTLAPAGGLSTMDLEGNPRTYAGAVDLGAYERGDVIFADDFET
jgi:hypothetical protein